MDLVIIIATSIIVICTVIFIVCLILSKKSKNDSLNNCISANCQNCKNLNCKSKKNKKDMKSEDEIINEKY